jgi:hypothetical protein
VVSIRDARWKFIPGTGATPNGNRTSGPVVDLLGSEEAQADDQRERTSTRLFDLQKDPAELHNVAAENPDVVERLKAALMEQRAKGVALPLPG